MGIVTRITTTIIPSELYPTLLGELMEGRVPKDYTLSELIQYLEEIRDVKATMISDSHEADLVNLAEETILIHLAKAGLFKRAGDKPGALIY